MAAEASKDSMYVTALARGIEVLRCFTAERPEMGTSEIARLIGLPQPTVYRLCYTLTQLGCLMPGRTGDKLRIGPGVLLLGHAAITHGGIGEFAQPLMKELADRFEASVSLGARDRTSMVIVQRSEAPGIVNVNLHVGSTLELANSSLGWAWLAAVPKAIREEALEPLRQSGTAAWDRIEKDVTGAIADYARDGFVLNLGRSHRDINAIGVPVVSADGERVMALTCGGVRTRMTRDLLVEQVGPELIAMARAVAPIMGRG